MRPGQIQQFQIVGQGGNAYRNDRLASEQRGFGDLGKGIRRRSIRLRRR
ncbi:hypothetical protein [Pandoraea capi]|nr:hypothetical protein [Pandoraea capi]